MSGSGYPTGTTSNDVIAAAVAFVKRNAAAAADPTLTDDEVTEIVQASRTVDKDGRPITDADYITTVNFVYAVVTAWETKAAKAACLYNVGDNGLKLDRGKIIDNCNTMAEAWRGRLCAAIGIVSPIVAEAEAAIEIISD